MATENLEKVQIKVKKPKFYRVLLHNDDYTTMEFVLSILETIFGKTPPEAQEIMLTVHQKGIGICGCYTYEVAESKVAKVTRLAKEKEHPLKCTMEPE